MRFPYRHESEETDRLLALSDGVIAIAITLLVLDITVPEMPAGALPSVVADRIFEQWQEYIGYALSFLVVGLYWMLHRRIFVHIETHTRGIVWLNLVFLLLVAFIPYGTSVFTIYPNRFGVSFIAAVLALTGLSLAVLWFYALRRQLTEEGMASRAVALQAVRFLASPVVFAISIAVASVDPTWGILTWVLLIPINGALNSRLVESFEEG